MIYTHIPYADSEHPKNLGWAYNNFMNNLGDNDWACFLDHDAMFTTSNWLPRMENIIKQHPEIGAFGCRTNRVCNTYQLVGGVDIHNHDIKYHRYIGEQISKKFKDNLTIVDQSTYCDGFSGVLILLSKKTWKTINGFKENKFLSVDDDFRRRLCFHNINFAIMNEIYIYHWYQANDPYPHAKKFLNAIDKANKNSKELFLYKQ